MIFHSSAPTSNNKTDSNINFETNIKPGENNKTTTTVKIDLLLNTSTCKNCLENHENENPQNRNDVKTQTNSICWLQIALPSNSEQVNSCQSLHKLVVSCYVTITYNNL